MAEQWVFVTDWTHAGEAKVEGDPANYSERELEKLKKRGAIAPIKPPRKRSRSKLSKQATQAGG